MLNILTSLLPLVSSVLDKVQPEKIIIAAQACKDEKCSRCWHRKEDVGKHKDFEDLCERCITNINGAGEKRLYV